MGVFVWVGECLRLLPHNRKVGGVPYSVSQDQERMTAQTQMVEFEHKDEGFNAKLKTKEHLHMKVLVLLGRVLCSVWNVSRPVC